MNSELPITVGIVVTFLGALIAAMIKLMRAQKELSGNGIEKKIDAVAEKQELQLVAITAVRTEVTALREDVREMQRRADTRDEKVRLLEKEIGAHIAVDADRSGRLRAVEGKGE